MRHDVTAIAAAAALVGLAATFLWTGLSKVSSATALRDTLGQLGVPAPVTAAAAWTVIGAELVAGVGLVVTPTWWWPRALVGLLAVGFAAAGLRAIASRRRIECRCFGNVAAGQLGWRQLAQLPVLLGLAALAQWRPPGWDIQAGLTTLAVILLAFIALRLPSLHRPLRRVRADRVAMASTYQGVPPAELMS